MRYSSLIHSHLRQLPRMAVTASSTLVSGSVGACRTSSVTLASKWFVPTTVDAVPVLGLRPCIAAISIPLAIFFENPSANDARYSSCISSAGGHETLSETRVPYSNLIRYYRYRIDGNSAVCLLAVFGHDIHFLIHGEDELRSAVERYRLRCRQLRQGRSFPLPC